MQYTVTMNVFQAPQRHCHPALDIRVLKDQGLVPNDSFQIGVQKFKDKIDVLLH